MLKNNIKNNYESTALSLFLIIQVIVIIVYGYSYHVDGGYYYGCAVNKLTNGSFFFPTYEDLYSNYWAGTGWINIMNWLLHINNNIYTILMFNCILTTSSAFYLCRFTEQITNKKIARISLTLYCVYLVNYAMNTYVLTEVPFFFFLISGLYYFTLGNKKGYVLSGILFAIANWIRPLAMLLIIPICIFLIYKKIKAKYFYPIIVSFFIMYSLIGLTTYANCGRFVSQPTTGWFNLLMGMGKQSNGETNLSMFYDPNDIGYIENIEKYTQEQRNAIWKQRGIKWMKNNIDVYIKQMPIRFFSLLKSDNYSIHAFRKDKNDNSKIFSYGLDSTIKLFPHLSLWRWVSLYNFLFYAFIMVSGFMGFFLSLRHKKLDLLLPLMVIICGFGLTIAVICNPRYHHPYIPFIMIGSAYLINYLINKNETTKNTSVD